MGSGSPTSRSTRSCFRRYLNAIAGFFYTHENYAAVTLAPDPSKYFVGKNGDTSYYFFETENLPLFGPLRSLAYPRG